MSGSGSVRVTEAGQTACKRDGTGLTWHDVEHRKQRSRDGLVNCLGNEGARDYSKEDGVRGSRVGSAFCPIRPGGRCRNVTELATRP